jgi:hypothetical protein
VRDKAFAASRVVGEEGSGKRVKQDPLPPIQKGKHVTIRIEGQKQNAPSPAEEPPLPAEIVFEQ